MKFTPRKAALEERKKELPLYPLDLRDPNLYVSGSKWDEKHLKALRVLSWDDLDLTQLIPDRCIPHPNSAGKVYI